MKKQKLLKKAGVFQLLIIICLFLVLMAPAQITFITGNPNPRVKPPKPDDPPEPPSVLQFAEHNIAAADFCGGLHLLNQTDGLQYEKTWQGGTAGVTSYFSLQIADVNVDGKKDMVAGAVNLGDRKNNNDTLIFFEIYEEEATDQPVYTSPLLLDAGTSWRTRVLVADLNQDGFQEVILKTGTQIHVFSFYSDWSLRDHYYQTNISNPNISYRDIAVGDIFGDGTLYLIVPAIDFSAPPYEGFVRLFRGDCLSYVDTFPLRDSSYDPNIDYCYLEDVRLFNLDGDSELEVLATSQAQDYNYSDRKHNSYSYTHLHAWDWNGPELIPLANFRVNNLNPLSSIAHFDVGLIGPAEVGVVLSGHGGVDTATVLGWNTADNSFHEIIHGAAVDITNGTGQEIWGITLADIDGDGIEEILFSGASSSNRKAYLEVFRWWNGGLLSIWNFIDASCERYRTHIAD
ncbi:MAG: VCBS repeat-containing protein [Pseudomonadota bacterium]